MKDTLNRGEEAGLKIINDLEELARTEDVRELFTIVGKVKGEIAFLVQTSRLQTADFQAYTKLCHLWDELDRHPVVNVSLKNKILQQFTILLDEAFSVGGEEVRANRFSMTIEAACTLILGYLGTTFYSLSQLENISDKSDRDLVIAAIIAGAAALGTLGDIILRLRRNSTIQGFLETYELDE